MKPSLKTLLVAAVCLLPLGGSHLSAQITVTPKRTYTGTITQTSAAGVASTGTITVQLNAGGKLSATSIVNGITTVFTGELLASDPVRRNHGGGYKVARTVGSFNTFVVPNSPPGVIIVAPNQIPVIVNKAVAYGGLQEPDGRTLTFQATRDEK